MDTVCEYNKCVGCYACKDLCPKKAIEIQDSCSEINAKINPDLCVKCGLCYTVCQINYPIEKTKPLNWFQGWSNDDKVRANSSSGGLAAELSRYIIKEGGLVCSCAFTNGKFGFKFAKSVDDLKGFSGSKYVKSIPEGVHKQVRTMLSRGQTILFIGLPCQCASLKKTTKDIKNGNLYLVDLICHGTPSSKILDLFLSQYDISLNSLKEISFRKNGNYTIKANGKNLVKSGMMDPYSIAFFNSLSFTENCYECKYADNKRISDLTIGDSWGSELSEEAKKGISLILCNSEKGEYLLRHANICIKEVDVKKAINSNPQLMGASVAPIKRKLFFKGISEELKFNVLVRKYCTKKWFKQIVKGQLIKFHLLKSK